MSLVADLLYVCVSDQALITGNKKPRRGEVRNGLARARKRASLICEQNVNFKFDINQVNSFNHVHRFHFYP